MEQLRGSVLVVSVIVIKGRFQAFVVPFKFNKHQRQAINEAN